MEEHQDVRVWWQTSLGSVSDVTNLSQKTNNRSVQQMESLFWKKKEKKETCLGKNLHSVSQDGNSFVQLTIRGQHLSVFQSQSVIKADVTFTATAPQMEFYNGDFGSSNGQHIPTVLVLLENLGQISDHINTVNLVLAARSHRHANVQVTCFEAKSILRWAKHMKLGLCGREFERWFG